MGHDHCSNRNIPQVGNHFHFQVGWSDTSSLNCSQLQVFMRHFFTVFSRGVTGAKLSGVQLSKSSPTLGHRFFFFFDVAPQKNAAGAQNGSLEQAKVGFARAKVGAEPKLMPKMEQACQESIDGRIWPVGEIWSNAIYFGKTKPALRDFGFSIVAFWGWNTILACDQHSSSCLVLWAAQIWNSARRHHTCSHSRQVPSSEDHQNLRAEGRFSGHLLLSFVVGSLAVSGKEFES